MFIAKIKLKTRAEKKKIFFHDPLEEFTHNGKVYGINPKSVYRSKAYGLINCGTSDYLEGQCDPIDYFTQNYVSIASSEADVVGSLIKHLMEAIPSWVYYVILITSAISCVLGVIILQQLQDVMHALGV